MWRVGVGFQLLAAVCAAADPGEVLFQAHCAPCHGPRGEGGRGPALAAPRLLRAPDDAALAAIITKGIPGSAMPGTRMTAEENQRLVAYVRALGRARPAEVPGDRDLGERIFWNKGHCGQCHTVGPRGGRMGPDLTEIGARRGAPHLRASILDPEAEVPDTFSVYRRFIFIPDNFLQVRVVIADGRAITGVRVDEDTFSIQLRDAGDHIYSFLKSELKELHKDWGKSPMPSYRGILPEEEVSALVAYLSSLRGGL